MTMDNYAGNTGGAMGTTSPNKAQTPTPNNSKVPNSAAPPKPPELKEGDVIEVKGRPGKLRVSKCYVCNALVALENTQTDPKQKAIWKKYEFDGKEHVEPANAPKKKSPPPYAKSQEILYCTQILLMVPETIGTVNLREIGSSLTKAKDYARRRIEELTA